MCQGSDITHFLFDLGEGVLPLDPPVCVREDERHRLHTVGSAHAQVQVHGLLRVRVLALGQLSVHLLHQLTGDVV